MTDKITRVVNGVECTVEHVASGADGSLYVMSAESKITVRVPDGMTIDEALETLSPVEVCAAAVGPCDIDLGNGDVIVHDDPVRFTLYSVRNSRETVASIDFLTGARGYRHDNGVESSYDGSDVVLMTAGNTMEYVLSRTSRLPSVLSRTEFDTVMLWEVQGSN